MGAGVTFQLLRDQPGRITSLTLVNPISPSGYGGTHGPDGELNDPSRQIMLATYVKPPFVPELADEFVQSMLTTRVGEDNYPGDHVAVDAWPGIAPGTRGVLNTMAPGHFRFDDLPEVDPKPPIRWIRGTAHSPHAEKPAEFLAALLPALD